MNYTLRWYQQEAVDAAVEFFNRPLPKKGKTQKQALEVLPTGSGKSLIISSIAKALGVSILVLQPSKEILEQNLEKFRAFGMEPSVFSASMNRKNIGDITLATIGSLESLMINEPEVFERFKLVIVDECDLVNPKAEKSAHMRLFALMSERNVPYLGVTASPYRLVSNAFSGPQLSFLTRTRPNLFNEVIYFAQNGTLFREGHLAKLEYHQVKGFEIEKLTANSSGSYTEKSVRKYFKNLKFHDKVSEVVRRLIQGTAQTAPRKNALVFLPYVEDADEVAKRTNAAVVSAKTPDKLRREIIAAFRHGEIKIVCNVTVLGIGFDFPELETVVLARPTMSLRLYYQFIGRAMRPHPGKESSWIVDMVGLVPQFGKIEDMRLEREGSSKWVVTSNGRPLTNTPLMSKEQWEKQKKVIKYVHQAREKAKGAF